MADSDLSVKVSADVSGIGAAMAEAQRTLSRASADLQTAGNAAKQASVNFASLAYNTRVLIDASGRTSRMTGSLVRITEELAAGRAMLFGMIGGAAAATAGIAYMAVEAAKARASV